MTEDTTTGTDADASTTDADASTATTTKGSKAKVTAADTTGVEDPGLTGLAGHEGTVHQWEASPAGQEFLAGEEDRQAAIKDEETRFAKEAEARDVPPTFEHEEVTPRASSTKRSPLRR